MTTNKSLEDLVREVADATTTLDAAQRAASQARVEETTCLNRLNRAQKEIDERVLYLRKSAPRASNWGAPTVGQYPKPE